MAATFSVEDRVVGLAVGVLAAEQELLVGQSVLVGSLRAILPVLRVEAAEAFFQRIVQLEVDIVVEQQIVLGLVGDRELHVAGERHREIAVEGLAVLGARLHRQAREIAGAGVAHAEEIADRGLDARMLLAVPIGAQHDLAQETFALAGERRPDMRDDASAFMLGDNDRLARLDVQPVVIAAGAVVARKPPRPGVAQLGQSAQR